MRTAQQRPPASVGEEPNPVVSFSDELDSGELLATPPIVLEDTTTDLTITNKTINTSILEDINGVDVPIGEAVQFHITGFVSDNFPYTINITVTTDAVPPAIKKLSIIIPEAC